MKIKKLSKMAKFNKIIIFTLLISFCVFSNSIASDQKDSMRDDIIKSCLSKHEQGGSDLYYCILSQLYAFERVLDLINKHKSPEDLKKRNEILKKYINKKYHIFDFIKVEEEFNYYLEKKKRREGKNGHRME